MPGKAIGAIDIYDDFTLVDVPGEYLAQVLSGMSGVTLRSHAITIRRATPRDLPTKARRTSDKRPPRAVSARSESSAPVRQRGIKRNKNKGKRRASKGAQKA